MKLMKIALVLLTILALVVYAGLLIRDRYLLDKHSPVISFESGTDPLSISVHDDKDALLRGIVATDDTDGTITGSVMVRNVSQLISENAVKVSYIVFDSSDNMATASRIVTYADYEPPYFTLTDRLVFPVGTTIALSDRLTATDFIDGDLTDSIRLSSDNLNNYMEGIYTISVMVTNSLGDTASVPLTVIIRNESVLDPVITLSEHLLYLDQGSEFDPVDYIDSLRETADGAIHRSYHDVTIESDVNTDEAGVYSVIYTYKNEEQRKTEAALTVVVK